MTQRLLSNKIGAVEIRFTQAARKHRVGKASARYVMSITTPTETTTTQGNPAWRYAGRDGRGRELEIVAVELEGDEQSPAVLLVIHVMPTRLRGRGPRA